MAGHRLALVCDEPIKQRRQGRDPESGEHSAAHARRIPRVAPGNNVRHRSGTNINWTAIANRNAGPEAYAERIGAE